MIWSFNYQWLIKSFRELVVVFYTTPTLPPSLYVSGACAEREGEGGGRPRGEKRTRFFEPFFSTENAISLSPSQARDKHIYGNVPETTIQLKRKTLCFNLINKWIDAGALPRGGGGGGREGEGEQGQPNARANRAAGHDWCGGTLPPSFWNHLFSHSH